MLRQLLVAIALLSCPVVGAAEDWPEFRGPGKQGHSDARGLPLTWSDSANVAWKVDVPGKGWSSPVILGKRLWLTSALDDGRSLRALCFDRDTGKPLQDVELFRKEDPGSIHAKNSHASPTPILEGDRVYVHFGAHGTACLTNEGKVVWRKTLDYAHRHGPGGSPELVGDLLIISCDGTDQQFVVALDKRTGSVRWRKDRDGLMAYSTPLAIEVNGAPQLVSSGGRRVTAYDPHDGSELWSCEYGDGYSLVPRPVHGQGLVFICTGYNTPWIYAIRPDGHGDVTDTHLAWKLKRGAPNTPSPILVGAELYFVSDKGIASCVDAKTGKVRWQERLGGNFSASPLFADGRLYFTSEAGVTTVLAPGKRFEKLATNEIGERTFASIAVSRPAMFVRTEGRLFRIEDGTKTADRRVGLR